MLAPIVVFVYNRLDHTKRLIDSLKKNELAKSQSFTFILTQQRMKQIKKRLRQ